MKKLFGIIFALAFFMLPLAVFAQQSCGTPGADPSTCIPTGVPTTPPSYNTAPTTPPGYNTPASQPVSSGGTSASVTNPLGSSSFCGLIKALLNGALQIGIPIAVLFIVYAGFKFVLARGNSEKLVEARSNMLWTVIGIGIFLGAWLLAQLIVNTVNNLQAGSGNPSAISCS